jgi:hypothetical protein
VTEPGLGGDLTQRVLTVVIWYAVSCIPIWMAGYLYSRQRRKAGPLRALLLGHLLLLGNYITYIACWRGFLRLIVGANGWQKTKRQRERSHRADRRAQPVPAVTVSAVTGQVSWPELAPLAPMPRVLIPAQRGVPGAEVATTGELAGVVVPSGRERAAGPAGPRPAGGSHRASRARSRTKMPTATR